MNNLLHRSARVLLLGLILVSFGAVFASAAANTVPASGLVEISLAVDPNTFIPASCPLSSYTNIVYGSGNISGTGKTDLIFASDGDDYVRARGNKDCILGNGGHDTLLGNGGADTLLGGEGDDYLYGGSGRDVIYGGPGDDVIYGGNGKDVCYGEGGNDYFVGCEQYYQ